MKFVLLAIFTVGASHALACTPNPAQVAELDKIYDRLKTAPTAEVSVSLTGELWQVWLKAPDSTAQEMLDRGMQFRVAKNFTASEHILTELIAYCPTYAEAYNQRAFSRYLSRNYEGAVPDLAKTLELRPRHLGALSGLALTHSALGDRDKAIPLIREMVRLNPWAPERSVVESLGTEL